MKRFAKKYILASVMVASATVAGAQELNSAYFTQDYKFRHELNAAFGNDQNYISFPALGNINVKMQGNFGLGDVLFKNPQTGNYNRTFMHPDVSVDEAMTGFNKDGNKLTADFGITLLSAGFKGFGGYNTIEMKSKTNIGAQLPYELFEFAKDIRNKDYEFGTIGAQAQSYLELALGHSHQLNENLRIGAKVKALLGVARADLTIDGMKAKLTGDEWLITSGDAQAEINMKGIEFKNTTDEYNRGGTYQHVDFDETDVDGGGIGGFGLAVDLGAEYQIIEGLKVSAAIKDLGFLNWSNNILLKQKNSTFVFDGFHDIAVKDETAAPGEKLDDQTDSYGDQLSDFVSFENKGDQGSKSAGIAATASIGVEYVLPTYDKLSFGLLGMHRFNGDYSWSEARVSANWAPLKWLDGGVNVAVNSFTASAGWILNIHPKAINLFVGMDHILGKQSKEFIPINSNASVNFGFNIAF